MNGENVVITPTNMKHELWIDLTKMLACVLVALGHLLQSLVKSNIIQNGYGYQWFNKTIYLFHVLLFFVCSGYIYQKYSHIDTFTEWKKNIVKKFISLGIPYFTFSTITFVLKTIFSSDINTRTETGLFGTLFVSPISPYWFLYSLFMIFVFVPTCKTDKLMKFVLVLCVLCNVLSIVVGINLPYFISTVFSYSVWFVIGMAMAKWNWLKHINKWIGIVGIVLFFFCSLFVWKYNNLNQFIKNVMGFAAVISIMGLIYSFRYGIQNCDVIRKMGLFIMPIYLMHTISASCCRIVLMKVGINNPIVHIMVGISASLIMPMIYTIIARKVKILDFFIYPQKYVKLDI